MAAGRDTTPRFEWRYLKDTGWGWSRAHTVNGPCPACRGGLRSCPRCGGRFHQDLTILDDGRVGEALFCQQERTDDKDRPTRMRSAESEAQVAARVDAIYREQQERMDRWIGRVVGGVLALKWVFAALFVVIVVAGILASS